MFDQPDAPHAVLHSGAGTVRAGGGDGEGGGGLAAAVEPVQSLAEEHNFPELYAVFVQQQLPLIALLQFQPEPLLPAQELPLMHDALVCTSKSSAIAREERRIGHLPTHTEAGTPAQHVLNPEWRLAIGMVIDSLRCTTRVPRGGVNAEEFPTSLVTRASGGVHTLLLRTYMLRSAAWQSWGARVWTCIVHPCLPHQGSRVKVKKNQRSPFSTLASLLAHPPISQREARGPGQHEALLVKGWG